MKGKYLRPLCALLLCACLLTPALAAEEPETKEEPEWDVTWETLEERVLGGGLTALALQENVQSVQALDYEQMEEQLRGQLNDLADAQWYLSLLGQDEQSDSLGQAYSLLREQFDAIRDGELQEDNADVLWQLEDASQQLVGGGRSLYLALVTMNNQLADVDRGLETLDRNLAELRLRRDLGQVSPQTVLGVEQSKLEVLSQRRSLENAISTYSIQLQLLLGEEPTGELTLGPLPEIGDEVLDALDCEADLAAAKEASWTLRSAQLTLDDAKEQWNDDRKSYFGSYYRYQYEVAEHTWNAAQLTYQAAVKNYETSFQTLYQSLEDYRQVLDGKESALAYQEGQLAIAEKKYDLGLISRFALLTAQDEVAAARSAAESARLDLFTAYSSYHTAVTHGILS